MTGVLLLTEEYLILRGYKIPVDTLCTWPEKLKISQNTLERNCYFILMVTVHYERLYKEQWIMKIHERIMKACCNKDSLFFTVDWMLFFFYAALNPWYDNYFL